MSVGDFVQVDEFFQVRDDFRALLLSNSFGFRPKLLDLRQNRFKCSSFGHLWSSPVFCARIISPVVEADGVDISTRRRGCAGFFVDQIEVYFKRQALKEHAEHLKILALLRDERRSNATGSSGVRVSPTA